MSASREKKQRQSDLDSLTEKQKKDRQEAAAQKRKVITYWIIGIVAVVIVVVLLVWNSGILVRNVTAATVGEQQILSDRCNPITTRWPPTRSISGVSTA